MQIQHTSRLSHWIFFQPQLQIENGKEVIASWHNKNTTRGGLDQTFPGIHNTSPPTLWTQWTLWCAKLSAHKIRTCLFYNAVSIYNIQQRIAKYADINKTVQKQDGLDTMYNRNQTLIFQSCTMTAMKLWGVSCINFFNRPAKRNSLERKLLEGEIY